ncbi:Plasmodium vivax Vir protein, putative [Plasmodium vivax]|nr:Plasmodium vivax Vir protein, putative [Plasmodium vivax]
MANHLTEEHLKEFTSSIKYSYFEREVEESCENIPFYSNIKGDIEGMYHNLRIISDKILNALCFIYNKKRYLPNNFDEELCSYLYYWLGEIIYPLVPDKAVFSRIMDMIFAELNINNAQDFIICKTNNSFIDQKRFNDNKVLFDYSKDYGNIQLHTAHGETTCDKVYLNYIKKYMDTYGKAYLDCYEQDKTKYDCNNFITLFERDKKKYYDLTSFSCLERENVGVTLGVHREHKEQQIALAEDLFPDTARTSYTQHSARRDASLDNHHTLNHQEVQGRIESPLNDDTSGSSSSKTIAGSVAPVLGVSSISLLLYKLTPVGGYINRLLGRNRNMHDPVEYMDSFNPYSDGMIPGDRTMNISYHRL